MNAATSKERYELVLEARPGTWRTQPVQRLRGLLKMALRAYGLRCVVCRPMLDTAPERKESNPL